MAAILTVLSLLPDNSMAGPPLPTAASEQLGRPELEVTVEAQHQRRRIELEIQTFVTSIVLPRQDESLARWQVPICPLVSGLIPEQGEFVRKRISQIAKDSGAPLALERCRPANFLVVLTPEPASFLRAWWKQNREFFNDDRGVGGVETFIRTPKPIRVWYNVMSECPYGRATYEIQGSENGSRSYVRCVDGGLGSKLRWVTVRKIVSAIVVADSTLVEGRTIGQLADYIAMIGLAQIRRNAEPGSVPTILRLFADAAPKTVQHLSRWDEAFLRSLYATDVEDVVQLKAMQGRMYGDLVR